ncbi:hypothetical protein CWB73_17025 [Pseudoalteromonas phenolica]|uniref:Protein TonB n=1 Tax=Pseudoalteromonas phenolica TaxID=161398 RepID=A0A5S3YPA6_9GAMM|nr:energy transducer TonB [Pseudoalteromonas phenolica]TMP78318.1 hypothetical protein CWB73_17025 [Pseudoalteromonas phenolica]
MIKTLVLLFTALIFSGCKSTPTYTPESYMHFNDSTLDRHAKPIIEIFPKYPKHLASKGIKGQVTAQVVIDEYGSLKNIRIIKSNPEGAFDEVAKAALTRWKFAPALYKGKPIKVNYEVTLDWGK